ncbi:MAG: invasion associated locus B family protein [Alphaproteobacteria bacterium]
MKHILTLSFVALFAFTIPAYAQSGDPAPLGKFGAWQAFTFMEDGQRVCYMASKPTEMKGKYSRRGDVFALITHRPGEGTKNVFSYITGYSYKPGSDTTVKIDGDSFLLFTQDDTAWAPDAQTDNKLAEYIRKGSKMIVTGTSSRGTLTTDTFSLRGSAAAHDAISKACDN